jgi:hypothetical protein
MLCVGLDADAETSMGLTAYYNDNDPFAAAWPLRDRPD